MSPDFDVQECVRRTVARDPAAARQLIEHLYPQVRRWVRNHLPRRESEEDLAQEVFLKLLQKLDSYQPRTGIPFEHWVSRLTVRTCLDALRAERSRPEWRMSDLSQGETQWLNHLFDQHQETTAPEMRNLDARAVVQRLLAQLSPADRLVLTLLDLEQKSTREIAEQTGWTRPMVKMRAMRARHKLKSIAQQWNLAEY